MSASAADPSARGTLVIERSFDAPRELVFDAWTKPEHLLRWFAPHGCSVRFIAIDVRPGGRFHSCIDHPSFGECWAIGTYLEIVRPERIVYTLATADSAGREIDPAQAGHDPRWPRRTRITVTFTDLGGSTRLTLAQTVEQSLAEQTGAYPSWLEMLDRLALLAQELGRG